MTKQVFLITGANRAPASEIITSLQSASIAVIEEFSADLATSLEQDWSCVLHEVDAEATADELRAVIQHAAALFPDTPVVACRQPCSELVTPTVPALNNDVLRRLGFRAIADNPAQLPALLRQLEDSPGTGELKPLQDFDRRPDSKAFWLTAGVTEEQVKGAFALAAALHLARNQQEAGQIALAGLARLITANRWSIFLVVRSTQPDANTLQHFVSRASKQYDTLAFDDDWQNEWSADHESTSHLPSEAAHETTARIDKVARDENGQSVIALPLVSEDILLGVLEGMRDRGSSPSFCEKEIEMLEALAIPIAAALRNSVRVSDAERLSHTDDLTKLHNARHLRQFLVNEVRRARRYSSNVAGLFLDLDDFKRINDLHGHLVGSHVLMEVAALILPSVRDTDSVVRYGGDEFVVILPETAIDEALHVAERIRAKLENHRFTGGRRLKLCLTASFGVAVFPQHASSPQQLIAGADAAMYEAKARGKNCVQTARPNNRQASPDATLAARAPFLKIPDQKMISR